MTPQPATDYAITTGAAATLSALWLVLLARRAGMLARQRGSERMDSTQRTLTASAALVLVIVALVERHIGSQSVTAAIATAMVAGTALQLAAGLHSSRLLDIAALWLTSLGLLAATAVLGWQALVSAV